MSRPLLLVTALSLLLLAGTARGAGTAYVVRSPSAGLYERPNAAQPDHTLIKGQVVTVLQRRGDWLLVITESGEEGWARESTLSLLPAGEEEESRISEASPDDIPEAVYLEFEVTRDRGNIRKQPHLKGPIVRTAVKGEVFTIVVEQEGWYQVSKEGGVEGWIHESVGAKRESRNLFLRALDMVEGKLAYFDQFKNETSFFRRAGWFPSFFLRDPEKDLQVGEIPPSGKEVNLHLSYALKDIEYRSVINAAGGFVLPGATKTFLADLFLSLFDLSSEIRKVRIHLWFGILRQDGSLTWVSKGTAVMNGAVARRLPREGNFAAAVWSGLEQDTIPPELWKEPDTEVR
jgi:SH3-like domain-containing protein